MISIIVYTLQTIFLPSNRNSKLRPCLTVIYRQVWSVRLVFITEFHTKFNHRSSHSRTNTIFTVFTACAYRIVISILHKLPVYSPIPTSVITRSNTDNRRFTCFSLITFLSVVDSNFSLAIEMNGISYHFITFLEFLNRSNVVITSVYDCLQSSNVVVSGFLPLLQISNTFFLIVDSIPNFSIVILTTNYCQRKDAYYCVKKLLFHCNIN